MGSDSEFVIVLTTFPADGDPEALATRLVEEGLAACVNVLAPMQSIYRWKGAIEKSSERQLLIKAAASHLPRLETRLHELHPYEVPEFVVLPISATTPAYRSFLLS